MLKVITPVYKPIYCDSGSFRHGKSSNATGSAQSDADKQPTQSGGMSTYTPPQATDLFSTPTRPKHRVKGLKEEFKKLQDKGIIDQGLDMLKSLFGKQDSQSAPAAEIAPPPAPQKTGMSTGAKIAIGVGAAAVIGVAIYFATKK